MSKITKLGSALKLYQKYEDNQLSIRDYERTDMHFNFLDGSDIVIEETGLHTINPFKFSVADIANWSSTNIEHSESVVESYQAYFDKLKSNYDTSLTIEYKPYFEHDGFDLSNPLNLTDADKIIDFCKRRILDLRINRDDVEAQAEIDHRRKNIFNILYCLSNKNLDDAMIKLYHTDLSIENRVTILQSVYEEEPKANGEKHTPYSHQSRVYTIGEVLEMLRDKSINDRPKTTRALALTNTTGRRIIGDQTYNSWSGLQIFDIDLKFSTSFNELYEDGSDCRDIVFEKLKKYPWFIGVTLSSSKRALHIYTKVSRMHHLTNDDILNASISKYWYRISYIQKHAVIAYVLDKHCKIEDVYSNKKIIDSALARIQQGIALNYDPEAKWSMNFIDLYPSFFYHVPPDEGLELDEWLLKPELLTKYSSWFYDNAKNDVENDNVANIDTELKVIINSEQTLNDVKQIDMINMNKGEKYNIRWRVCNTLAYSYGDTPIAKELAFHILQAEETNTETTIESFLRSAILNRKEADTFTVKLLKKLGLQITFDDETVEELEDESMSKVKFMLDSSEYTIQENEANVNIKLEDNEYLGMIMPKILGALKPYKLNLLASAPNTGKTEFFKSLAKKSTVCLVIPFTSTIDSKIINDKSMTDIFDIYYGNKSVSNIVRGKSVVMTFDKFSAMSKSKYEFFDYIAIDESHLCFTSIYRLPVVSKTIENIRTYLEKDTLMEKSRYNINISINNALRLIEPDFNKNMTKIMKTTKFIMMTGTITGEIDYFEHYGLLNYIKVHKKHPYKKNAEFILSKTNDTKKILICKYIAKAITDGKKIIHPTNLGDAYAKQILAGVEVLLKRKVKYEYYKRANSDEDFMEDINKNTTIKDIELLFCSDYLSVGIDIKDSGLFEIIFNNDFTAESIEQFNNRLRSTNIECKVFYDVLNASGDVKSNILNNKKVEYVHNEELAKMIQDEEAIAKLQKSMVTSNRYYAILGELFSKYFITDYAGNIKYIKAAFEIEQFELQYTVIAKSLIYVKTALEKKYQYNISFTYAEEFSDSILEFYDDVLREARDEHLQEKDMHFRKLVEFLSQPDVYRILTKETYHLIKETITFDEKDELGLFMQYDQHYHGGSFVITWDRKYKFVMQSAIKFITKFRKLYSYNTIKKILELCESPNGLINKKELHRYDKLMKLIFNDKKEILSDSTKDILEMLYEHLPPSVKPQKIERDHYEYLKVLIKDKLDTDFLKETENTLQSTRRVEQLSTLMSDFIEVLFKKRISKTSVKISYRCIYAFDSESIYQSIERDKIFRRILLNEDVSALKHSDIGDHVDQKHIAQDNQLSEYF